MFDPYHKWLGIPPDQRPPTYYQLLGISPNEKDREVIREAGIRQTAHLRTYQTGPLAVECTRLLNEVAQAQTVLLDPAKRKHYDARLAKTPVTTRPQPPAAAPQRQPVGNSSRRVGLLLAMAVFVVAGGVAAFISRNGNNKPAEPPPGIEGTKDQDRVDPRPAKPEKTPGDVAWPASRFHPLPLDKAATVSSDRPMFADDERHTLVLLKWGEHTIEGVPFLVADPQDGTIKNAIVLHSSREAVARTLPLTAQLPCDSPVKTIHLLSGVCGWGHPGELAPFVVLIVRLHYENGTWEEHPLLNGVHFTNAFGMDDVPKSKRAALKLKHGQVRYLCLHPRAPTLPIKMIEFIRGTELIAPVVLGVTVEKSD